jgi:hypothetical protein
MKEDNIATLSNLRAGHKPPILGLPGNLAENSTIPPVKQNLFHPCNIDD